VSIGRLAHDSGNLQGDWDDIGAGAVGGGGPYASARVLFTDTASVTWDFSHGDVRATSSGGGSSSPLTTKGDLWGFDTADARVPVGSNGKVLTADSGAALGVSYKAPVADLGLVTGTGTADYVAVWTTSTNIGGYSSLFYDHANTALGINTGGAPTSGRILQVGGAFEALGTDHHFGQLAQRTTGTDTLVVGQGGALSSVAVGNAISLRANHAAASSTPSVSVVASMRNNADSTGGERGKLTWKKVSGSDTVNAALYTYDGSASIVPLQTSFGNVGVGVNPLSGSSADYTGVLARLHVFESDTATTTTTDSIYIDHLTSGSASTGFGTGILWRDDTNTEFARLAAVRLAAGEGNPPSEIQWWNQTDAVLTPFLRGGALLYGGVEMLGNSLLPAGASGTVRFRSNGGAAEVSQNAGSYATVVTGGGTSGQAAYWSASGSVLGGSADYTWDNTNHILGLGTVSSHTGVLALAHASSANLTKIQAGNAASALSFVWPAADPTAGQVLTGTAPSGGVVTMSWADNGAGGSPTATTLQKYLGRGYTKAGFTANAFSYTWDDFHSLSVSATLEAADWLTTYAGGGTQSLLRGATDVGGGVLAQNTVAAGGGLAQIRASGAAIANGPSAKWYMAARIKVGTTPVVRTSGSGDQYVVGAVTASGYQSPMMGVFSQISTGFYMVCASTSIANSVLSTVAPTTNWVIIEAWQDGTNIYISVNDETPVSHSTGSSFVDVTEPGRPTVLTFGNASSAARTGKYDWALWMYPDAT
jgi:hypothetical protein